MSNPELIRQCAWCNEWLDERSKEIAESIDKIRYIISHGICDDCANKLDDED